MTGSHILEPARPSVLSGNGCQWHCVARASGQWGRHPVSLGLETKHVRLHPLTWAQEVAANRTGGIALRLEVLRKVECGDGWDLAFEGCDDGNLESGDGCSGSLPSMEKLGSLQPRRHSSIYGRMTTDGQGYQQGIPQPYLTGNERTLTTIHSHFNRTLQSRILLNGATRVVHVTVYTAVHGLSSSENG